MFREVSCAPVPKKIDDDLSIIIDSATVISEGGIFGMLQTVEYQYKIRIPKLGWSVVRRQSDFVWLREKLVSFFPYICVPFFKNYKKTTGT
jgi:hypothetical protein